MLAVFCRGLATISPNCGEPAFSRLGTGRNRSFRIGGANMSRFGALTAMILGLAAAYATDAWAGEVTAAAAVCAEGPPPSPTCVSLEDFVITNCPLTWNGVTVYGTIDAGVTWRSHGAPFNGTSAIAEDYLIQKYSNHAQWGLRPNALSQSNIGI